MKEHTDEQLKLALAKMLPEKICSKELKNYHTDGFHWIGIYNDVHYYRKIEDTEWLHVCWLIESPLNDKQKEDYMLELWSIDEFYLPMRDEDVDWYEVFNYTHATWQQRAIALAKVKGIKI